jgi:NAD(P)-dependent dehydrogenase (short-subunit alcohol dehydrogenase family)
MHQSATPWYGTYCTTKAAVHMLTDTLDMELRPFNIKVMLLAIGMIRSTIVENTAAKHTPITESYYDAYRKNIEARLGQGDDVMPADVFARKTVDAALAPSPPTYMAFGGQANFFTWLHSILPRSWQLSLSWKMYSAEKPKV